MTDEEERGAEKKAIESCVAAEDRPHSIMARGVETEHGPTRETTNKRGRAEKRETGPRERETLVADISGAPAEKQARIPGTTTGVRPAPHPLPVELPGDPFSLYHSVGLGLRSLEELNRLKNVAVSDPDGVQHSLKLGDTDHMLSAEDLVVTIHGLISNVMPRLVRDLDALLASVSARYGVNPVVMHDLFPQQPVLRQVMESPQLPEPLVPAVPELSREALLGMHGPPVAVVEKKMSNREYMSRFRLNTKFVSDLLPAYDHTSSMPTIYGAIERLLCADITICTVDGRPFKVVYELARTVKNDWLHHRFTIGWAEVVRQLGIEIGDLLVFERWTEDRTLLTMQIVKGRQLLHENPQYAMLSRPMTVAERKGQF